MHLTFEFLLETVAPEIRIEAEAERGPAGRLALGYFVSGDIASVS